MAAVVNGMLSGCKRRAVASAATQRRSGANDAAAASGPLPALRSMRNLASMVTCRLRPSSTTCLANSMWCSATSATNRQACAPSSGRSRAARPRRTSTSAAQACPRAWSVSLVSSRGSSSAVVPLRAEPRRPSEMAESCEALEPLLTGRPPKPPPACASGGAKKPPTCGAGSAAGSKVLAARSVASALPTMRAVSGLFVAKRIKACIADPWIRADSTSSSARVFQACLASTLFFTRWMLSCFFCRSCLKLSSFFLPTTAGASAFSLAMPASFNCWASICSTLSERSCTSRTEAARIDTTRSTAPVAAIIFWLSRCAFVRGGTGSAVGKGVSELRWQMRLQPTSATSLLLVACLSMARSSNLRSEPCRATSSAEKGAPSTAAQRSRAQAATTEGSESRKRRAWTVCWRPRIRTNACWSSCLEGCACASRGATRHLVITSQSFREASREKPPTRWNCANQARRSPKPPRSPGSLQSSS
mmetsp:Transcript_24060/g.60853  ORF Transcript_24060/g.60853 Transcript_24060/m.60853 type:complete len:476 (-) Transcript_24060:107-1534(-)